jgi:hypothetical protein
MAWRAGVRASVVVVLGLAAFGLIVYYYPWSNRWVDRTLQAQWLAATGLGLQYDKATFQLSRGQFDIKRPTILDPRGNRPLLAPRRLSVRMSFWRAFARRGPMRIDAIELTGPLDLRVSARGGTATLDAPWDRIVEIARDRAASLQKTASTNTPPSGVPAFAVSHVTLLRVGLRVAMEGRQEERQSLLRLDEASIETDFDDAMEPLQAVLRGRLNGRDQDDGLMLSARRDAGDGRLDFTLSLRDLASHRDAPWPFVTGWKALRCQVQGTLERSPGAPGARWRSSGMAVVDQVALTGMDAETTAMAKTSIATPPILLGGASLAWRLQYDADARSIALEQLDLHGDLGELKADGSICLDAPRAYALKVHPLTLTDAGVALLAKSWPPLRGLARAEAETGAKAKAASTTGAETTTGAGSGTGSPSLALQARGSLDRARPDELAIEADMGGCRWSSPAWPVPLRDVSLRARLTPQALTVDRLRATVGVIPVDLHGQARGDALAGRVDALALDWSTSGTAQGLMRAIGQSSAETARMGLPSLTGDWSGQGTLRVERPLEGSSLDALARARLGGSLTLRGVALRHPKLPAPVEGIAGRFDFARDRMTCHDLAGRFLGAGFTIDGELTGEPCFWLKPQARLTLAADGRLERIVPVLRARFASALRQAPALSQALDGLTSPTGRLALTVTASTDGGDNASSNVQVNGPTALAALANARLKGSVRLDDAATTLSLPEANGRLRLDAAQVDFTDASLKLAELRGALGAIAFEANGDATPSAGGKLDARLEGAMAEVKRRLPWTLRRFKAGGHAVATHHSTFAPTPGVAPSAKRWADLAPLAASIVHANDPIDALARAFAHHMTGDVQARDLEMTFNGMPTPLRGIGGQLRYDDDHVWSVSPLTLEGGEGSHGLVSDFSVSFPKPGRVPNLSFDAQGDHFALSSWATEWKFPHATQFALDAQGRPRYPRDYKLSPAEALIMTIDGRVRSKTVAFYRLKGQDFDGNFHLDIYPVQPNVLRWDDVRATIEGGKLATSGRDYNFQMWNEIRVEGVDLAALTRDVSKRERPQGIFSGVLSGSASLYTGFNHFDSPPTGKGELRIEKSRFVSNAVLGRLGGMLSLPIFDDVSFSRIQGPFTIQYPTYKTEGIVFENPLTNLELSGTVGPNQKLDLQMKAQFLRIAGSVPLVGNVLSVFNKMAGTLLRFHVTGTVEDPKYSPL